MDKIIQRELKPGLLSNKPIVEDSCSDSDSSNESKKSEKNKPSAYVNSNVKKSPKRHSGKWRQRSRSREHHKHKSHGSHSYRHHHRSKSNERRHNNHRYSSKSDYIKHSHKSPKRSPLRSPQRSPRCHSPGFDYQDVQKNYKEHSNNRGCDDNGDSIRKAEKIASNVDSKSGKGKVERARKAQDYRAKELIKKTEAVSGVTLPKFYKPSVMNPIKFAETEQKRKLLWSKKNEPSEENKSVWNVTSVIASRGDDKGAAKFKKLMGIHDTTNDPSNPNLSDLSKKVEEQAELFRRLDADYQSARNHTHTARGVGLGYNQSVFIDPSLYLAGKRDVN